MRRESWPSALLAAGLVFYALWPLVKPLRALPAEPRWRLLAWDGCQAELIGGARDGGPWRVNIVRLAHDDPGQIRVRRHLRLEAGRRYRLSCRARAHEARTIYLWVGDAHPPFQPWVQRTWASIGPAWVELQVAFDSPASDDDLWLAFDLGSSPAAVELDRIELWDETGRRLLPPAAAPVRTATGSP